MCSRGYSVTYSPQYIFATHATLPQNVSCSIYSSVVDIDDVSARVSRYLATNADFLHDCILRLSIPITTESIPPRFFLQNDNYPGEKDPPIT